MKFERQIKIGEFLVQKNLIEEKHLDEALNYQKFSKSKIGEILRVKGFISNYNFYKYFAEYKSLKFTELDNKIIEKSIVDEEYIAEFINKNYLPFEFCNETKIYKIATTEINENLLKTIQARYKNFEIFITTPSDIVKCISKNFPEYLNAKSILELYNSHPKNSAKDLFNSSKLKYISVVFIIIFLAFLFNQKVYFYFALSLNIFYFSTICFKLYFIFSSIFYQPKHIRKSYFYEKKNLPVYSILVPLFKEGEKTLEKLISAINNLEYPKEKLDVKLIVEEQDSKTIKNVKWLKPPAFFEIIYVPYSLPQTKPKACNYALQFCKGEYVTIYDAEDCPDKFQLLKALEVYENDTENKIGSVQARLTYYNHDENLLTKFFTIEYYSWFNILLKGLYVNNFPIPLGGTSNHFRIETLKKLCNWDPFNVTEDADLGVRLYFSGYKTALIDSDTYEEACIGLKQWVKQRSRWIKGYMQTFLVCSRNLNEKIKSFGLKKVIAMFYFIAAPAIVFISAPILAILSLYHFFYSNVINSFLASFGGANILLCLLMHSLLASYICIKQKWRNKIFAAILFGFYWVLHSIAGPLALVELILKPHHWNKTEHGKSKFI
jgi:hypothetical protein